MNHRRKIARLLENIRNQLNDSSMTAWNILCEDSKTDNQPVQNSQTTDNEPI